MTVVRQPRLHRQDAGGGPGRAPRCPAAAPARPPGTREVRLEALFDPGSLSLLTPPDDSGVLTGTGTIDGMPAVAFASDPRVQGGAMGSAGCAAIVAAYDRRDRGRGADHRAVALRRRPAARGRREPARRGHGVRRHDPGLGQGPADLGGARRRRRRRRLRPGPHRPGDPVRPGPHLRHRPRCRAQRDRRGRRHGAARRPGAAQPPLRCRAPGDRDRRRGDRPGPAAGAAARPAEPRPTRAAAAADGADLGRAAARVRAPRLRRAPAGHRAAGRARHRAAPAVGPEHRHHPGPAGRAGPWA